LTAPSLDLGLSLLGFGAVGMVFLVNKFNWKATSGASAAFFAVVFFYSSVYIGGAAGV